ncbi:MAG TPA: TonB-dependent receptor, partial [Bacteroidales bacterium]|nr:TonB-dependent receptor [Bacteroidales bacterium]
SQFFYQWKKLNVLGGIRYDFNSFYDINQINPHLAVLYHTSPDVSFRFSLGTAYKIPPSALASQSLAYPVDDQIFLVAYQNRALNPEKFYTTELGVNFRVSSRFSIEHTFFAYRINNHLIPRRVAVETIIPDRNLTMRIPEGALSLDIVNDSTNIWTNYSASFSTVGGAQTTLRFNNILKSIKLNAEASVYFQARQDRFPNVKEFVEKYMTVAPAHIGKLKVSMQPHKNFYLNIESHWMSKWLRLLIPFEELYSGIFGSTDGYYAMDVTARYYLSDQLNTFIKITNLFDEKYAGINATLLEETLPYTPQLRRTARLGLSYKLN